MFDKSIKRTRMEKYFIDAGKQIIQTEGIKSISVRKVGEKAGYSYATIYNYFKDSRTLMAYIALDYLDDVYQHLLEKGKNETDTFKKLLIYSKEYFLFMVDNPDIFKIIFLNNSDNIPPKIIKDTFTPDVSKLLEETLNKVEIKSCFKDLNLLHELLTSSIHGKIMFCIGGRHLLVKEDVLNQIEKEIEVLING